MTNPTSPVFVVTGITNCVRISLLFNTFFTAFKSNNNNNNNNNNNVVRLDKKKSLWNSPF